MNRNQLDEMQQQKRNKIGHQTFILMFYLLLIDIALHGFGFRWLDYPTNVFILMLASIVYYMIRLLLDNAFLGPGISARKMGVKTIAIMVLSAVIAYITASLMLKGGVRLQTASANDYGAIILFIFSIAMILLTIIAAIIAYKRNNSNKE